MCYVYNGFFRFFLFNKFLYLWNCRSENFKILVEFVEKKKKKKKKLNEEVKEESKVIFSRIYLNGFVVEEIRMGKFNGKKVIFGK